MSGTRQACRSVCASSAELYVLYAVEGWGPPFNFTSPPTAIPTLTPTGNPTMVPTELPTAEPSGSPTTMPSPNPTTVPSPNPTTEPTATPSTEPTAYPTAPSAAPTLVPSMRPTQALTPEFYQITGGYGSYGKAVSVSEDGRTLAVSATEYAPPSVRGLIYPYTDHLLMYTYSP
jgi:hypothetical protein